LRYGTIQSPESGCNAGVLRKTCVGSWPLGLGHHHGCGGAACFLSKKVKNMAKYYIQGVKRDTNNETYRIVEATDKAAAMAMVGCPHHGVCQQRILHQRIFDQILHRRLGWWRKSPS